MKQTLQAQSLLFLKQVRELTRVQVQVQELAQVHLLAVQHSSYLHFVNGQVSFAILLSGIRLNQKMMLQNYQNMN